MIQLPKRKKIALVALLYASLILLFTFTQPEDLPLGLLFAPFVLIFLCLLSTLLLFMPKHEEGYTGLLQHKRIIAAALAAIPTMALLLSSVNQLTVKDVGLLAALLGGGLFYSSRIGIVRR